jgi:hypothetical protein
MNQAIGSITGLLAAKQTGRQPAEITPSSGRRRRSPARSGRRRSSPCRRVLAVGSLGLADGANAPFTSVHRFEHGLISEAHPPDPWVERVSRGARRYANDSPRQRCV